MRRNIMDGKNNRPASPQASGNMTDAAKAAAQMDAGTMQNVQQLVDRYSGKSDDELMGELKSCKQMGLINDDELSSVVSRISPMLNSSQLERLSGIMRQLKG